LLAVERLEEGDGIKRQIGGLDMAVVEYHGEKCLLG